MTVSMCHRKRDDSINWRTHVSAREREEAIAMWNDDFSTYDIAQALNIYEAVIYNNLPKWRGKP